jgi:membrane-bound lytic murein transglycosylase B
LPGEAPLSALGGKVRLVVPEADKPDQAYLVGENYEALLSWNRSNLFALSVAKLAERIAP